MLGWFSAAVICRRRRHGLAGVWLRGKSLAKSTLTADLTEDLSLEAVAGACRLSPNRFGRAFRNTTGLTPFAWARAVRIGRARELLCESSLLLAQITDDCGFADQAHFTQKFSALVGVTRGAWRRAHRA
jgi:AraC family transcriptional regulator